MQQKFAVVTGANSGVGFATAKALAASGVAVVMVCRDMARGQAAHAEIASAAKDARPILLLADLSSQREIRSLVEELRRRLPRIDILINNAGAIFTRRELTVDGIEKTFAVNHLAPFLLTHLVLEHMGRDGEARVIMVGSETYASAMDFDNLQGERTYNFFSAYRRSKLGNILFTFELARRLRGTGITANCMSPGPTATRFGDDMTGLPRLFPLFMKRIPFLFAPPVKPARELVELALAPELADISGRFFLRGQARRTKPVTHEQGLAERFWRESEKLTGIEARMLRDPAAAS
jgi:NAD(P)-dependent dehydrogenase (short-subunit alcohol dehydrogenase family)